MKLALLASIVLAAVAAGSSSAATNECRGLNPCVPVAGPWVVVPNKVNSALALNRHSNDASTPTLWRIPTCSVCGPPS